ncbi:MAG: 4a-hydroxytetrahydrobiopterin dehydratase [Gammaproteobacteria bacterium]|nr:4a-hydroxytetrahydrobiopterin dehydratase [Gammaproteobacteria bacterium]
MLDQKSCIPCQGGIPPLTGEEAAKLLPEADKWKLIDDNTKLQRNFAFDNFVQALNFVNKVGELSEAEGHHPDISFGWGYCSVIFYTHKINGLHENDFVMAAKTNKLYKG